MISVVSMYHLCLISKILFNAVYRAKIVNGHWSGVWCGVWCGKIVQTSKHKVFRVIVSSVAITISFF